jgi:predicted Zn-dependent protease
MKPGLLFKARGTAMKRLLSLLLLAAPLFSGCTTVEGTGRRQLMLVTEDQEQALGLDAYRQILADEKISNDSYMTGILRRVGERIAVVADRPDFEWEFNLIESEQVNAFCLPGGKIAVYTGILPIMKNEAGMAAVIGHEVAHAIARHSGERMSQHMSATVVGELLAIGMQDASPGVRETTLQAFGVGTQVGVLLPFSREHESEADVMGLMYTAKAGYDPRESVRLWQRMKEASGKKPPEFLSTHPSEDRRINELQDLMPKALKAYEAVPEQYGLGQQW